MADDGRRPGVPEHVAVAPGTASGDAPAEAVADGIDPEREALAFTITDAKIVAVDLIDDPARIAEADLAILGR
jgi:hypothetical protein